MAIDYGKTAEMLVKEVGGEDNIVGVTHCATRLRFILKDNSVVNKDKVSKIQGVITVIEAGGQFQVVIGNHVKDAYQFVTEIVNIDNANIEVSKNKSGVFSRIIDVISSIFAPFLYTLAACGILQGILGIFVAMNAIDTAGGTYRILNFISWTAFTFLPVLISVTASKKFGVNTYVAIVIACALVCPDYLAMVDAGEAVYFLGMHVQLLSYTSSVIPII
ncbi:MAG: PTS transporter subunit EIIB, partial [Lachnospiraceae bacterium]|nr:PTS transporter subunit EIIB [Lachnospiraceae bacterium]